MTIEFTATEEAQLEAAARHEGIDRAELVRKPVTERLAAIPPDGSENPTIPFFTRGIAKTRK